MSNPNDPSSDPINADPEVSTNWEAAEADGADNPIRYQAACDRLHARANDHADQRRANLFEVFLGYLSETLGEAAADA